MRLTAARLASALCLLLACGQLTGCSQWRYDLGPPLSTADLPDPGNNISLQLALDLLGPPQRMSATDNGYVLAWEHWHIRENSLGLSLGAMGAKFFSLDGGEMQTRGEFLLLTFDEQHLLTSSIRSHWDNNGGGGAAIQPFLSLVSLVDVRDLVGHKSQHRWGGSFLQRPSKALNNDSNPDTGQNGLQQLGTPTAIGQQSLEMD